MWRTTDLVAGGHHRPVPHAVAVTVVETAALDAATRAELDRLWTAAFADWTDDDAAHARGGLHALARDDGAVVAHAAVVPRTLLVGGEPWAVGYVEGVATLPARQGEGLGSAVVAAIGDALRARWPLGALSTGAHPFYARLGWERWHGASYVVRDGALVRTEDDDDGLMVLRHGPSAGLDLALPIACEDRPGDPW